MFNGYGESDVVDSAWSAWGWAVVVVVCLTTVAQLHRAELLPKGYLAKDRIQHLGAEHYCVGRALHQGRGFSDPFCDHAGATAWVAPALPSLIAVLMLVFGESRSALSYIMLLFQTTFVLAASVWVCHYAARVGRPVASATFLLLTLLEYFNRLFQETHDAWVTGSAVFVCFLLLERRRPEKPLLDGLAWGVGGILAACAGPVTLAVWCISLALRFADAKKMHSLVSPQKLTTEGMLRTGVAMLCVSVFLIPWTFRNYMLLGSLVCVKSNGAYEVWQSLCVDEDGVLDLQSGRLHPWVNPRSRMQHKALGETTFVQLHRNLAIEHAIERPFDPLIKVVNRFLAVLVLRMPVIEPFPGSAAISLVLDIVFPLPFMAWLFLIFRWATLGKTLRNCVVVYPCVLAPYIIISYCERYSAAVFWIKPVLVVGAIDQAMGAMRRWKFR
ncbi:hypothetical protein [Crateriforma conspicua]|uniref:hypothetical protein n=1 Tax=Crateriforma conspicua TaxID=2527996 RepID=UPI00118D294E|nr:hypothetical protein [Crateriforma conspicua]QDV62004.1 hypothetical protein Mal65_11320 [Crateriforma conspicua]